MPRTPVFPTVLSFLALTIAGLLTTAAAAQTAPPAAAQGPAQAEASGAPTESEQLLARARGFRCAFPASVKTNWNAAGPQTVQRSQNLNVNLERVESDGTAAFIPARGSVPARQVLGFPNQRVRQFLDAGQRVTVLSIYGNYAMGGTKLKAAYSLHDWSVLNLGSFQSEPDVLLYWGECEALP